jgi:predicted nucleic acid-binding protein
VRCVVSDTGPLFHLTEADAFSLTRLVGDLHIPSQVHAELAYLFSAWESPPWLKIDALEALHAAEAAAWQQSGLLDPGEAEAIALARQIKADWLLTDDAAARLFAAGLGLEVHGSLGVVLWAAATGHLDRAQADQTLAKLAASSLWISGRILAEAKSALDEIF